MKTVLSVLIGALTLAWGWALFAAPAASNLLWIAWQQGLYLTGLLSIALMSLSMLLSTRPVWLEKPLSGLDQVYRLHKWSGILSIAFGAGHWLIKLSSGTIKTLIGRDGRVPKVHYEGFLELLRQFGNDLGEPALYLLFAMLIITLWRRFPYHLWRHLHRAMPVLYLMLALHTAMLAPSAYWSDAAGMLLAICIAAGTYGAMLSLLGRIGHRRRAEGTIISVNRQNDVSEVVVRLDDRWQGHRAGQFAYATFSGAGWLEGAHPFTIASADGGDRTITFCIRSLGDFTERLARQLAAGQKVDVEGPYGRFQLARQQPTRRQTWIAGGVGITPFIAWLESLRREAGRVRAIDLHFCTRDRDNDPFVSRLQTLCGPLPGIRLRVHSSRHGERLSAPALQLTEPPVGAPANAEIWFCGPRRLAEGLKAELRTSRSRSVRGVRFHEEAFVMR